jgi:hypothetical protein
MPCPGNILFYLFGGMDRDINQSRLAPKKRKEEEGGRKRK